MDDRGSTGYSSVLDPNWTILNGAGQGGISRRQLLALLAACGGASALAACAPQVTPPVAGSPPTFDGYSIFRETMVELPWPEVEKAAKQGAPVILPVAVIEEHGPHLGLAADVYLTYLFGKLIRRALEPKGIPALLAPPYYWGINASTGSFAGSFSVRESTLKAVLYDLHDSLQRWGFKRVFSLNLHGDPTHNKVLQTAVAEAREGLGMNAVVIPLDRLDMPPFPRSSQLKVMDVHAGALETAQMMAFFPQDVNAELAKTLSPSRGFTPHGYYGDPARFDLFDPQEVRDWATAIAGVAADWIEASVKEGKR